MFAKPANHIYVIDKNPPFKLVKVIEEGTQPLHPEFTADGKFVYVADWQENIVRVYNADDVREGGRDRRHRDAHRHLQHRAAHGDAGTLM